MVSVRPIFSVLKEPKAVSASIPIHDGYMGFGRMFMFPSFGTESNFCSGAVALFVPADVVPPK